MELRRHRAEMGGDVIAIPFLSWLSWLFAASLILLPAIGSMLPSELSGLFHSDLVVAFHQCEKSSQSGDLPAGDHVAGIKGSGRAFSWVWERCRDKSSDHGVTRELLHQRAVKPGVTLKLDFCSEFTKPGSLVIRSMGTPKNHRSPPA
jgi:hypothetical protein